MSDSSGRQFLGIEPFEELPFNIDSKVNKVHHKAEKDEEHETGIKYLFHLIGKQ
jgi:hypothetical protein